MSLDERLLYIVLETIPEGDMEEIAVSATEAVAQIKQAFADEGYMSKEDRFTVRDGNSDLYHKYGLMTGQEWYDRFTKEYITLVETLKDKDLAAFIGAKRAAGLEATDE